MSKNEFSINIDGKRYNKYVVVETHYTKKSNRWKFKCICDCGKEFYPDLASVLRGNCKSCGCDRYTHKTMLNGKTTRLYRIWSNMKARCENPKRKDFYRYGGRGIKICKEWSKNFDSFKVWSEKNGYKEDLTIDRIDNKLGYCPENCRWATTKQQAMNRKTTRNITYKGKTMPLVFWAKKFGLTGTGLAYRIDVLGQSIEQAFQNKNKEYRINNLRRAC